MIYDAHRLYIARKQDNRKNMVDLGISTCPLVRVQQLKCFSRYLINCFQSLETVDWKIELHAGSDYLLSLSLSSSALWMLLPQEISHKKMLLLGKVFVSKSTMEVSCTLSTKWPKVYHKFYWPCQSVSTKVKKVNSAVTKASWGNSVSMCCVAHRAILHITLYQISLFSHFLHSFDIWFIYLY